MLRYLRLAHLLSTVTVAVALCGGPAIAQTESGLIVAAGLSSKGDDKDFTTYSLGWRFPLPQVEMLDRLSEKSGGRVTLIIEPLLGLITGDADSVECSVVPMARYDRPLSERWGAVAEVGLGLTYSDLRGIKLGSSQAGIGLVRTTTGGRRVSVGLRIRHISHAGFWAEANSGLNTHYLTVSFD